MIADGSQNKDVSLIGISFLRSAKTAALAAFGSVSLLIQPAIANEDTAGLPPVADVLDIAPATATAAAPADADFTELFAVWDTAEIPSAGDTGISSSERISIPSSMPLQAAKLTSDYGMRVHPVLKKRKRHNGVDLAAPTGTPVYATADGVVSRANRFSSYGLYISIEHGGKLQTRFAHLSGLNVRKGQEVKKGDLIGFVGSTGRSTGPHLHYEVRMAGRAVNPIPYMVETEAQHAHALVQGEGGQGGQ